MSIELFILLYGVFGYTLGLILGFFNGREYERYKNIKKWDQDVH